MILRTHIPVDPLNQFVASLFYYEGFEPGHNYDRFLPDGHTEMIIDLTETPKFIYDNESLKEIQACHQVWVSGLRTEYITIPSGRDSRMCVVTFHKGKSFPFYPFPVTELTDSVVDADLIYGDDIVHLRERMLEAANLDQLFQQVERFFLKRLKPPDLSQQCIGFAVQELCRRPNQLSMLQLCQKIGYSQKHFIHMFKQQVGVSPKRFLNIMRFQRALERMDGDDELNWQDVYNDCGFYDQAHFIHEFKRFSGFTPVQYAQKNKQFQHYVPVG